MNNVEITRNSPQDAVTNAEPNPMRPGDRVMVYDSPGHPLPHYLYADVLNPMPNGAVVLINHPANLSDGKMRYVPKEKLMTAADALQLAEEARQRAKDETDPERRRQSMEQVKHHEFIAGALS